MAKEETKGQEVAVLQQEATDLSHVNEGFKIETDADMEVLSDRIKQVKEFYKRVEEKRDKSIEPAQAIIQEAKDTYNPIILAGKNLESALKAKGIKYVTEKNAKIAAEEKKITDAAERGGRGGLKPETAVKKLEALPQQQATVKTGRSSFQVKTVQDIVIEDESKIPDEYFNKVLDLKRVKAAAITAKLQIPGVRVITKNQAASV